MLDPSARLLNWPNKIVPSDWDEWVGERAQLMPSTADARYTSLIEVHDRGRARKPKRDSERASGEGARSSTRRSRSSSRSRGCAGRAAAIREPVERGAVGAVTHGTYFEETTPREDFPMCRNIKVLANFEPPATDDEIRASALQFVRKLSGTTRPSRANEAAFNLAVDEVTAVATRLIQSLETNAAPRNREEEARKAQERSRQRFG